MKKDDLRDQIAKETERFLREGKRIEKLPTERICPEGMEWIAERGMDYTTWDQPGSPEWEQSREPDPEEENFHG